MLLTLSLVKVESSHSADEHIEFMKFVLEIFKNIWKNVCCIIGDDCNFNKCIKNVIYLPMTSCYFHRFNIAMKMILGDEKELID